jgi:hypothetical protein
LSKLAAIASGQDVSSSGRHCYHSTINALLALINKNNQILMMIRVQERISPETNIPPMSAEEIVRYLIGATKPTPALNLLQALIISSSPDGNANLLKEVWKAAFNECPYVIEIDRVMKTSFVDMMN